jgi:RNA polymerase sigma-70 factor (ECF subfamily)
MNLDSSHELLERARRGDAVALDRLCARYLPRLKRWAAGRLPAFARTMINTDDLVQDVLIRTIKRIDGFEPRHDGALPAYFHRVLENRILEAIRKALREPERAALDRTPADDEPSPIAIVVGLENLRRYREALERLRPADRAAIVLRIELGYDYQELAAELGKPSANAARMAVMRAMMRLAEVMSDEC